MWPVQNNDMDPVEKGLIVSLVIIGLIGVMCFFF